MANRYTRRYKARVATFISLRNASILRSAGVLVAIVAMMVQSFAVQTHVHHPVEVSFAGGTVASGDPVLKASPAKAPVDKYPVNEDPANCPLCQEVHHSGAFVAPVAALLALPFYIHLSLIIFNEPVIAVRALSHNWQGRAPPRA